MSDAPSTSIVFADGPPSGGAGLLVHYDHAPVSSPGWTQVVLRPILATYEDRWLSEIDQWHRDFCRDGADQTRWWWLLPCSRLSAWYPFPLKPVLVALALAHLKDSERAQPLWVVGASNDTVEYVSEWAEQNGLSLCDQRADRDQDTGDVPSFSRGVRVAAAQFREVISVVARAILRDRSAIPKATAIVWSHTLNPELMRRIGDHFFGRMFDGRAVQPRDGVVWYYQVTRFSDRAAVQAAVAAGGRRAVFDGAWFRWSDLMFVLRAGQGLAAARRQMRLCRKALVAGRIRSVRFVEHFFDRSVQSGIPLHELLAYRAIGRAFRQTGASSLIYPYEEKGIERAMLLAAQDAERPIRTVAFAHAAYSKGHRFVRRASDEVQPRPLTLAVTGPAARDWFATAGVPQAGMTVVGTPRHQGGNALSTRRTGEPLRVLFLVGYPTELQLLATAAATCPDLLGGALLFVRRYPFGWLDAQDRGVAQLRASGVPFTIVTSDLDASIADADVVLYSSTSAGVEAILRGRVGVRVALDDMITADPLEALQGDEAVPNIEPSALPRVLAQLARLNSAQWQELIGLQQRAAARLYDAPNESAIAAVLSGAAEAAKPAERKFA